MQRPNRIVHITTVHNAFDQRIFHRECASLAQAGYDVTLLAFGDIAGVRDGVKIVSLGKEGDRRAGLNLNSRRKRTMLAFKEACALNADLYHFHDPELIGAGILLKKRTNACVVYDCHEDNVSYMLQKKYIFGPIRRMMATIVKIQEWRAVKILDAIITADEGMRSHFNRNGAKSAVRVDNFPRLDLFLDQAKGVIPKYDLVYHGTIPKYHLETCFAVDTELLKNGLEVTWLFIGKYADLDWARGEVRKRNAEKRFMFQGKIAHEEIASWVRLGRIGIVPLPDFPKFRRNVATKMFEFMALEMPVVLSDLPPARPFVGDGKCALLVDPNSPRQYADAIASLLADPSKCIDMGAEGKRRVVSDYNWDASFNRLNKLYERLLCQKY